MEKSAAIFTASSWFFGSRYQRVARSVSSMKSSTAALFFFRNASRATQKPSSDGPNASFWSNRWTAFSLSSLSKEKGAPSEIRSAFLSSSIAFMAPKGASTMV